MSTPRMSLADMIVRLRADLQDAQRQAEQQDLKFQVEEIDVELQITTAKEGEAKGGVNFWVYTAEAGGKISEQTAHTLRLKLKPIVGREPGSGTLEISDVEERL